MRFHRLAWSAVALFAVSALSSQTGVASATEDVAPTETVVPDYKPPSGAENFEFQAEVHKMLDIVVNSLYTNKDVFLRELISNASDALDKLRFLSLTKPDLLKEKAELEVRVEYDSELKTLTIRDSGIGMTHDELVANLGTVARSGTSKFLEAMADKKEAQGDLSGMIGKFGVGFYSSFLVASRVTVATKHPDSDKQYVWESVNGEGSYHIYEDPRGSTLGRGTEITLHLKDDAVEYANETRLKKLVGHYSEFVTHPIHLRTTKTETVEIDEDEDETLDTETKVKKDDIEISEDDETPKDISDESTVKLKPKKTQEVTTVEWEEINNNPAIWTRDKEDISDDEYQSFWKVVAKEEYTTAARWTHFNAEGSINFKSILYLPEQLPDHYKFGNIDSVAGGLKLYVRKVLISDEFNLMPRYLGFIRGVVDSDDLPLNVNRETLQESKIIKVIKKKLVRKVLDLIRAFSKEEAPKKETKEAEIDADGNVIASDEEKDDKDAPYLTWYKKFAPNLKMGVIDDQANRGKLAKLLRFQTSKSDGKLVSFEDYIANMKDWQEEIFVLAGLNIDEVKNSAFLDRFIEKDVEVMFLVDPVDEYMIQQMRDFEGKKFQAISAESAKLKDEDVDLVKRREKAYRKKFMPLTKYLKKLYGPNVMRVAVSKRLGAAPAIISSSEYGHSANMERIMRAQAFNHGQDEMMMRAMKVLELNPRHPLVLKLLAGCPPADEVEGAEPFVVSKEIEDAAWTLHDMALLSGGFPITDNKAHSERLVSYLQTSLKLGSLTLEDEIDPPVEDEKAPDFDPSDMDGMNMGDFNMDDFDMDSMNLD